MGDLDEALARFQLCNFEYAAGVPNYGPMAAAGLAELGHEALIVGLIDVYAPRLPDCPTGEAIPENGHEAARGRRDAFGSWLATYRAAIAERPWQQVLKDEVPALVDGICGASVHGLLRTALAVQALDKDDTSAIRQRELAFGLAHWASCFDVGEGDRVRNISDRSGLREEIHRICVDAAKHYLDMPSARAANTAGVTGPGALALLAPHIDPTCSTRALSKLLALNPAASTSASDRDRPGPVGDAEVASCAESVSEIRYRAACSLQEHAIPFVAACLREDDLLPDPTLRQAAADAALRLSPAGYRARR